jgi:hypothetical protein
MTKDEALKLVQEALSALENMSTALREDDVLGSDIELMLNTITAIHKALAQPDEDAIIIQYHEATIKRLEKRVEELTVQPAQAAIPIGYWHYGTGAFFTGDLTPVQKKMRESGVLKPIYTTPPLPVQECNFCPRCGKRTADPTTIHTCTPPRENT